MNCIDAIRLRSSSFPHTLLNTPDKNLILRPCTEDDIPALAVLHQASFTTPSKKAVFGNVSSDDKLKLVKDNLERQFAGDSQSHSYNLLCVVDTSTNEIISYATWVYLPDGYLASAGIEIQHSWLPPGTNETLFRDFDRMTGEIRSADSARKEPHWLLSTLATSPKHEGRGAGSMLIRWAFPKADEMGVKCFVEASAAGYPVYRKRGFEECVGIVELDLGRYEGRGGGGVQRWVAMMRKPVVKELV